MFSVQVACIRNIGVRALCNEALRTMSGGEPSSIKRIVSCAAASLHTYVPNLFKATPHRAGGADVPPSRQAGFVRCCLKPLMGVDALEDIAQMTAQEAADAAALLSGTVHAPAWVRIKSAGKLVLSLTALVLVFRFRIFGTFASIVQALLLLAIAFAGFADTADSFWRSITFDGVTGQIICRRPFKREWVFYASQIEAIQRTSEQYGENDAKWVRTGGSSHLVVTHAHFLDRIILHADGDRCYVMRCRTSLGRNSSRSYEGGDVGIETFDRYLRLHERSMQPDPAPDEDGLAYQRAHFPMDHKTAAQMPSV